MSTTKLSGGSPQFDGLRLTPVTEESAPAWSRLHHIIAEDDGAMWKPTPDELRESLTPSSTFDPVRQTWALWSGQEMVAYAHARVPSTLGFDGYSNVHVMGGVHPRWRGRGLGSGLLALTERTGKSLAREHHPDAELMFNAHTTDDAPAAADLLEASGYSIARYWFDMTHDLRGQFTADPRAVPLTPELSQATRLAHNDAFSTHWGSSPITPEQWQKRVHSPSVRPDLSRIIVEDGVVLAYAIVSSTVAGEAYFDLVGVRARAQGRGLGRAVVASALAGLQAQGSFHEAGLDVDAENPSGAGGLYTSVGFTNAAKKLTWRKPADAARGGAAG